MRFRDDAGPFLADDAASFQREEKRLFCYDIAEFKGVVPAAPGDTWRTRWSITVPNGDGTCRRVPGEGPIAGYAICCPKCLHVHFWQTAHGCPKVVPWAFERDGVAYSGAYCVHQGVSSCWQWSGDAEANTLSASPSLHCDASLGGCGWHGHLTDGLLTGA